MSEQNYAFDDIGDLDAFSLAMATSLVVCLQDIVDACGSFPREIRKFHPVKLASTFGGLLTQRSLQSNCLRLETLAHLSIALGEGSRAATPDVLIRGFVSVGSVCGHLEDPPEDVFVGNIGSERGNYLVLEGLWESGVFCLQQFVNIVDEFPDEPHLRRIANSIHALLKLSDLVCRRAGLTRNERGSETRTKVLPKKLAQSSSELRGLVQFTFEDLKHAGIDLDDIAPFIFDAPQRSELLAQSVGHTELERQPIALAEGHLFLVLPTAVSAAIRRFYIRLLGSGGNRHILLRLLGRGYSRLFERTPMLGRSGEAIPFSHAHWGSICGVSTQVDEGRYLNLVFILDTLDDFAEDGLMGMFAGSPVLEDKIAGIVESMQDACAAREGFRDGVTLIVICGVGRGATLSFSIQRREHWEVEHLNAADFYTLSWSREMKPLQLWRLFRMRQQLLGMNARLKNVNGLLNLVAWADSLKGHLVPHADIPMEATKGSSIFLITQNALLDLRHEVATAWDMHVEQFIDGSWRLVHTEGRGLFEEDKQQPVYICLKPPRGFGSLGACITKSRVWWFEVASPTGVNTSSYERWQMLGTWCSRAVAPLEAVFARHLGRGSILWKCIFLEPQRSLDLEELDGSPDAAEHSIGLDVDDARRIVQLTIDPGFDHALFNVENVAEAALVKALIRGVAKLAGDQLFDFDGLFVKIVPNTYARQSHAFAPREFRDFIPTLRDQSPITITSYDDGTLKLGLGWKVRHPSAGGLVEGKVQCRSFLNELVQHLLSELCQDLRAFNRQDLLSKLLLNFEAASASRGRWHRTAAAVLALRSNQAAALEAMRNDELKLNAVFLCTRILIEMAISECPLEGGYALGELDHSLLMAKASEIFHLGGWSDLIHWGFLEPKLIIRPLGDVHVSHDFIDTVIEGFGNATSEHRFKVSARRYDDNLSVPDIVPETRGILEEKFLDAWLAEFKVELDAFRRFVDKVENWGIELGQPFAKIRRSELELMADDEDSGRKIIEALSLIPRHSWRDPPAGHDEKDIAPWRFRRRLSALRRPLIQLSIDTDPEILVAPSLLREGFVYTFENYYAGSYADQHLGFPMKKYAGYARHRDGMQFNTEIVQLMGDLGWKTHAEIAITKIVGKELDRNYGDVDVLAWDKESQRVLVMECKDLQFRKTFGEIAEQLMDFAGVVKPNGKPDLLRKHLDRIAVLQTHRVELARFLGLDSECRIESHLVFSNPVPMQFFDGSIKSECSLHTPASLQKLQVAPR